MSFRYRKLTMFNFLNQQYIFTILMNIDSICRNTIQKD